MHLFSFSNLKSKLLAAATAVVVGLSGGVTAQSTDPLTSEDLLWLYVEQLGSANAYAAYLIENPSGKFAELARSTLVELAEQGLVPSDTVEGIEVAGLPEGEALAQIVNGGANSDLGRFFFIEYAV